MLLAALPPWTDWLQLLLQSVTFVALVVYVAKTWEMAAATREAARASAAAYGEAVEARAEALAPRVLLYLSPEVALLRLVVENAGAGTAADVTFSFDPPLGTTHPRLKPIFFDSPQALLPPGYKLVHTVDSWPSYLGSDLPKRYNVTISYRGVENNRTYSVAYVLDMDSFRHLYTPDRKGAHDIGVALLALKDSIPHLASNLADRLDQLRQDALLGAPPEGRAFAEHVADFEAMWTLLKAATDDQAHFIDRKALARRLRSSSIALYLAASRDARLSTAVGSATSIALACLDEREASRVTSEWQTQLDGVLSDLQRQAQEAGAS